MVMPIAALACQIYDIFSGDCDGRDRARHVCDGRRQARKVLVCARHVRRRKGSNAAGVISGQLALALTTRCYLLNCAARGDASPPYLHHSVLVKEVLIIASGQLD